MEIQKKINEFSSANSEIFSVSQITNGIKLLLEDSFSSICVRGEISNFKHHFSSKHMYFSMKDENCELKSVMFNSYNKNLKFNLEDGMEVLAYGDISVYSPRGQYQLLVKRIEPAGLGTLYIAFEKLKKQLSKEGIFDDSRKKKIPAYPFQIGIITSATGAVVKDIQHILRRRAPHIKIILRHTIVQGEDAASDLVIAIKQLEKNLDLDLIIVGRGGGSIEDLWAFNEEKVVRAVANCTIPIISAVGHETDYTIMDFVADLRAPTPSAAAELASPSTDKILSKLIESSRRLSDGLKNKILLYSQRLDILTARYGLNNAKVFLGREAELISAKRNKLLQEIQMIIAKKFSKHELISAQLEAVNPVNTLERGFAIPTSIQDGKFIKNINDLTLGQRYSLQLSNGSVESEVKKINKEDQT